MKVIVFLILLILLATPVLAMPILENLTVAPQDAYLGENIILSFTCFSSNSAIQEAKTTINGPGVTIPDVHVPGGPAYSLVLDRSYIDRIGSFAAIVSCRDNEATANGTVLFTASQISGGIKSVSPQQIYAGDLVDVVFAAEKNNVSIMDVNFSLYVDGQQATIKTVLYDTSRGWILRFDAPATGEHQIKAIASLDRTSIIGDYLITVRNPVEFSIVSIDKTTVSAGDNITLTISASDHGVQVNPMLTVYVGNTAVSVEITRDQKYSYARLTVPGITPKSYSLRADMNYNSYIYQDYKTIDYIVPMTGTFASEGKAINAQIRLVKGGVEKIRLYTDASGSYSSTIVPGTYDAEFIFPESTITLKDAQVESFNNPVGYSYLQDAKIPGVKTSGVYFFSSSLAFSIADIVIPYNEQEIDEDSMKVYKCPVWSVQDKACRTGWLEMNANIDKSRNIAVIGVDSLGAFAVGMRQKIVLNLNVDKKSYTVKDIVRIRGNIQDLSRQPIPNGKISVRIGNSEIGNISSDNNGVFTIEFISPSEEGNYTFAVTAAKQPYMQAEKTDSFEVRKSRSISILFPDSIRAPRGGNVTKELIVINTGQEGLRGDIELSGIDVRYSIGKQQIDVPVGSQDTTMITFYVPQDAEDRVMSGTLKIRAAGVDREKQFVFTVEGRQDAQTSPATGFSFALPSLPVISAAPILELIVFAGISFSTAFIVKKMKSRRKHDHMSTLMDIKNHIKSRDKKRS